MDVCGHNRAFSPLVIVGMASPTLVAMVVMNPHRFSNVPSVVRGGLLPPEPKLCPSPIVSQILLNYI